MTVPLPQRGDRSWFDWAKWVHERLLFGGGGGAELADAGVAALVSDADSATRAELEAALVPRPADGTDLSSLVLDSDAPSGVRWATAEESVARALGWVIGTDPGYGAIADWTGGTTGTDNTAAIQAGRNAASASGRTYWLPAGSYKVTGQINLPQYTDWRGAGWTALSQEVYGGPQWLSPTPGVTYRGTVIVSTVSSGSAVYGDHPIGARWTLRDFLVVGRGNGTATGIRLADTLSFNIRPNLVNVGVVNFPRGWKIGGTNEGTYDSLVSFACATGVELGPDFNANVLSNLEIQRSTIEGLIVDGYANHFSGGIVQSCSGTTGIRVAKPGNTFDSFYLENITAAQSVRFDHGSTFNAVMASNAGSIYVNASGVLLSCLYANSATVHVASGVLGTVLVRCSVAGVDAPNAEVVDVGSIYPNALTASEQVVSSRGAPKWKWSVGTGGRLLLSDVANSNRAALYYTPAPAAKNAYFFVGAVTGGGLSDTAGRPDPTSWNPGGQWYDTTLKRPIFTDGTIWRDALGNTPGVSPVGGANQTGAPLTLTGTNQDVPGATVTFTAPMAGKLHITGTFDFQVNNAADVHLGYLNVDGADRPEAAVFAGSGRATISRSWAVTVTAGEHTVKLRASRSGSGTPSIQPTHTGFTYQFVPTP